MQTSGIVNPQPFFGASAAGAEATNRNEGVLNSDFNTFLKMLTAQMTNQDPLNPIDSSEYAAQLAAFSSVEQQVVTNGLLEDVLSMLGSSGLSELSGWIGRDVRSSAPANFQGEPIEVEVIRATGVDQSALEVFDQFGNRVRSVDLEPGAQAVEWHGLDDQGAAVPAGEYLFRVNNFVDGNSVGYSDAFTYQEVIEVRSESGRIQLVLGGGSELSADSVSGLRN